MSTVVVALGILNLVLSLSSLRDARRKQVRTAIPAARNNPTVTLFIPCCGDEEGLGDNLEAIAGQDFSSLSLVFVVKSGDDGAVPVIERVRQRYGGELVIAGEASGCSQKVHNLLRALDREPSSTILAFTDSDGRPDPGWLRRLIAPLDQPGVGAASTYRFYVPEPRSVSSLLRSVWNASVLSLLGDHDRNFAWGGGMAIQRARFDAIGVREAWQGALSDDYALTHAVRRAGLRVAFVPEAIVPSYGSVGFAELMGWVGRQMSITRVYWPALFRIALLHHCQYVLFFVLGPWAAGRYGLWLWSLVQLTSLATALINGRRTPWSRFIKGRRLAFALAVPAASFMTLAGGMRALWSRRIVWRERIYEMRSPTETIILR